MMELNEIKKAENLDICPYCGGEMFLDIEYPKKRTAYMTSETRFEIFFTCGICESRSPYTTFKTRLLDEDLVKADILRTIDSGVKEATYCNINEEDIDDDKE